MPCPTPLKFANRSGEGIATKTAALSGVTCSLIWEVDFRKVSRGSFSMTTCKLFFVRLHDYFWPESVLSD